VIIDSQPLTKFQTYYATWRFLLFTCVCFEPDLIKSTPSHSVTLWFILMLSYHLCLGHPSSFFPSGLCINILCTLFFLCVYYMHHPFILLDLTIYPDCIWWRIHIRKLVIKLCSLASCYFLHFRSIYLRWHPIL